MSKERIPHIPNVPTTPERVIEEQGSDESKEKVKLSPEQVAANVNELMDQIGRAHV